MPCFFVTVVAPVTSSVPVMAVVPEMPHGEIYGTIVSNVTKL